jgi:CcmD family protein
MDTRNFTYMFYGFSAAWLIVVIYVVLLAMRERRLYRELDRVRKMVESGPDVKSLDKTQRTRPGTARVEP